MFWLGKNDKIIKTDKKNPAYYLNEFFSSIVENLDIKRYEIGSDSINIDPTLKAILRYRKCSSIVAINGRYKVKDTFNFNEVHVTKIKNQILKLNKRKSAQSYNIPTGVINLFSDVLCNNFNNLIVS